MPACLSGRELSRRCAVSGSQCTATQAIGTPDSVVAQCAWEAAARRKTSSTMTGAPARAVAAMPVIHAVSSRVKVSPIWTAPSALMSKPSADCWSASGKEATKSSMLVASQGSRNTSCIRRTMLLLPALDPPLTMITLGGVTDRG